MHNQHNEVLTTNNSDDENEENSDDERGVSVLLYKEQQQFIPQHNSERKNENNGANECNKSMPLLHTLMCILLYEPIMNKTRSEMISVYWIDTTQYYDFFVVTISRFFYYMGISSQTFFLYFIHDMLKQTTRTENPEAVVALIAIIGQCAGAVTCLPVGILSDQYFNGRRKPFVYIACILLAIANFLLSRCTTLKQMITVCILAGASNGIYLTMDTSLAVDTLDADSGEGINEDTDDVAAQLLGVWGVFGFLGSTLGPIIGGIALLYFGRIPQSNHIFVEGETNITTQGLISAGKDVTDESSPSHPFYNIHGYDALFSLSAFYFFCSATSLAFVKKRGV